MCSCISPEKRSPGGPQSSHAASFLKHRPQRAETGDGLSLPASALGVCAARLKAAASLGEILVFEELDEFGVETVKGLYSPFPEGLSFRI